MSLCIGVASMIGAVTTALVGGVTPDDIKSYVAFTMDPWDTNEQIAFQEPMGSFGIEYDLTDNIRLFAEHLSSPMQCDDHPGVNHAGFKLLLPINDVTLYGGASVNYGEYDVNDNFEGPLMSLGVEYGPESYKVYAEHLSSFDNFIGGRAAFGLKVLFR